MSCDHTEDRAAGRTIVVRAPGREALVARMVAVPTVAVPTVAVPTVAVLMVAVLMVAVLMVAIPAREDQAQTVAAISVVGPASRMNHGAALVNREIGEPVRPEWNGAVARAGVAPRRSFRRLPATNWD
jgi:hypothetical protein